MKKYDFVALGSGTASLVASIGVARLGLSVCIISDGKPGGDCLWTGCVPSKSLIETSRIVHEAKKAHCFGLHEMSYEVDLSQIMKSVRQVQEDIEPNDSKERLESLGIDVIDGRGRFDKKGTISIDAKTKVSYRRALIGVGTNPSIPPIEGLETIDYLTSDSVWDMQLLPKRLLVVGAGAIGCELAQAFARLGSKVTIVESGSRILSGEPVNSSEILKDVFESEGIDILSDAKVGHIETISGETRAIIFSKQKEQSIEFDQILIATGRTPNTSDIGLGNVGVDIDEHGYVKVDDTLRTTDKHIFSGGDVTGKMPFTHVAGAHGRLIAINAALGTRRSLNYSAVPYVIFTDPQIARVGISPENARRNWSGKEKILRNNIEHSDRAKTARTYKGFYELVGNQKGMIVGATLVGPTAGENISEMVAWITAEKNIGDISKAIHPYPTYSELSARAADEYLLKRYLTRPKKFAARTLGFLNTRLR